MPKNYKHGLMVDRIKIGIVGAGQVGSAAAFALRREDFVEQIVLVDKDASRAKAEALDISHAFPCDRYDAIIAGGYEDLAGASIVIVTAGANHRPGQTRLDLMPINVRIFSEIIPQVVRYAPDAQLLITTNPVDVMTEVALQLSGFPPHRVFGSGTVLDSTRFVTVLAENLRVAPRSIQASVIGEHGDSEVLVWSKVTVTDVPLETFARNVGHSIHDATRKKIHEDVRDMATRIIAGKGATAYGIGGALCRICRNFALQEEAIMMLSTHRDIFEGYSNICFSSPAILGRDGIQKVFLYDLDPEESAALQESVKVLKQCTDSATALITRG